MAAGEPAMCLEFQAAGRKKEEKGKRDVCQLSPPLHEPTLISCLPLTSNQPHLPVKEAGILVSVPL